jgi:PhnB protein
MAAYAPKGFRTLTGYPVVSDAPGLIEFLKNVFLAEETFRTIGGAGGVHAEMRVGDSMLMLGGGGPELRFTGPASPMAFHINVPDVDATFEQAILNGARTITTPADQSWGERTAGVVDPFGNHWYIGTRKGKNFIEGLPALQPYLHGAQPVPLMDFIRRAFGAEELGRYAPEGRIQHATLKIGDATVEISEAGGPYQPMPSMFYLYVADADAAYRRALDAGATSLSEPADQAYGDRTAAVSDPFGNRWYMATSLPKV